MTETCFQSGTPARCGRNYLLAADGAAAGNTDFGLFNLIALEGNSWKVISVTTLLIPAIVQYCTQWYQIYQCTISMNKQNV